MTTDKYYKIRDKRTGLFSGAGSLSKFTKNGKVWKGMGPLKNHLRVAYIHTCVTEADGTKNWRKIVNGIPEHLEVLELEMIEVKRFDARSVYPEVISR